MPSPSSGVWLRRGAPLLRVENIIMLKVHNMHYLKWVFLVLIIGFNHIWSPLQALAKCGHPIHFQTYPPLPDNNFRVIPYYEKLYNYYANLT